MKRTITKLNCLEITNYIEGLKKSATEKKIDRTRFDHFSPRAGYALFRNFKLMKEIRDDFMEYRNKLSEDFNKEYFNDEKSEIVTEEYEEAGETKTREYRRVKTEFADEYKKKGAEIDSDLSKILLEEIDLDFREINLDKELDLIPNDIDFTATDFRILELFTNEDTDN